VRVPDSIPAFLLGQRPDVRAAERVCGVSGTDRRGAPRKRGRSRHGASSRAVLQAFREANDALVGPRTSRDQRVAQAGQVAALRQASELAELRYRGGAASYLEVLDAQRGLFSAELALGQAQLLELSSVVQLFRALGGSWN
jgi:multidrug efflux system outer membrane protein